MEPPQRYRNPIVSFDVPDPDVIALAEGGYVMVASSFGRRPGLPLWQSDDLVEWRPAGFAGGWQPLVQPSGGVWAPAIREHGGRLFITWADPDRGVYVVEAPGVGGPWSEPRLLIEGPGPIDPCPFWDEDGRAWIVHGWARSRAGFANRLDIVEADAGMTAIVGTPRVLIDGDALEGCSVLEGPKLYRRGGDYYLFAPAGGVETGWQYVFRSPELTGTWESRVVLEQGSTDVNGPHQGAWVTGADGEEWFLHFQHTPHHGRILHLQPLTWSDDGWPRIGAAAAGGPAEPVDAWRRPTPRPGRSAGIDASVAAWHGRGADPTTLLRRSPDGGVELAPGGAVAQPLDRRTATLRVEIRTGEAALILAGTTEFSLVRLHDEPGDAALVAHSAVHVHRPGSPCELSLHLADGMAVFAADGIRVGEPFAATAPQWTGLEYAVAAVGPDPVRFEHSTAELR